MPPTCIFLPFRIPLKIWVTVGIERQFRSKSNMPLPRIEQEAILACKSAGHLGLASTSVRSYPGPWRGALMRLSAMMPVRAVNAAAMAVYETVPTVGTPPTRCIIIGRSGTIERIPFKWSVPRVSEGGAGV